MMVQFDVKRVSNGAESFMVSFDFTKTPITQVADYIIIAAAKNKTSDIHFDPRDEGMMVRFRIDGDCQDYTFIPKAYEKNLTTRLKLLANMNITETRLPQDGAIKGDFGGQYLDMRVACLPTNQGEKIVIRILDYTRSLQGIDSLGFHPKNLEKIKRMMGVPNGIILVTGATGSGKSTTTYSMLSGLNKPEVNVITVEDPVEMNIEGINQVQVNAEIGMTFAAALRSILREDPNVILIGEIRDSETAQIAVRASITGHLVMSTLHTNNALATVERLLDMDVERYLLSTALTGIISQRLAKQLCPDCRYQRETTPYEKKVFKSFLHQDVSMVWDANPKGCENCRKGYRGRIAVHEVLELDEHVRNALNDTKMSKEDFSKMIYNGKTITMLQDALTKVLEGQTSFEEVYRTIEIENEDEDNYAEEVSEIVEQEEEKEETNLPTGDDLLEVEGAKEEVTPLAQAVSIPDLNTKPAVQPDQITEKQQAPVTTAVPKTNEAPVNQTPTVPTVPTTPVVQPQSTEQQNAPTLPSLDVKTEVPATPVEQLTEQKTVEPTQQNITKTPETEKTKVPTATIGPDGKLVVPPVAEDKKKNEQPITQKQTQAPETQPTKTIVEAKPKESPIVTEEPQIIPPLAPTIEIEAEKTKNPIGYKIVMPSEGTTESKELKKDVKKTTSNENQPLAPLMPIQEEYRISAEGLDDDAPIMEDNQPSLIQDIVTAPIPTTQVQQIESPIYATTSDKDEFEAPSFATNSNPTAIANQLTAPIIINEHPVEAPIPRVQAISLIPGVSEETQEMTTGAEVLNDPGIRIAEDDMPVVPTLEIPPQQLVIPTALK